jgi:ribosomal protein L2
MNNLEGHSFKLTHPAEASRAKHKFAVKRNSWPKTRGVAMNPVDHVRDFSAFPHD